MYNYITSFWIYKSYITIPFRTLIMLLKKVITQLMWKCELVSRCFWIQIHTIRWKTLVVNTHGTDMVWKNYTKFRQVQNVIQESCNPSELVQNNIRYHSSILLFGTTHNQNKYYQSRQNCRLHRMKYPIFYTIQEFSDL